MSYRRRNLSIAMKDLEAQVLADDPPCAMCGAPAVEVHGTPECCVEEMDQGDVEPVCRSCHDATGCTDLPVTAVSRWVDAI